MRSILVLATILCFASVVHAAYGPMAMCCLQWSTTRVPLQRIKSYTIQSEGVCPISAVMLKTRQGKTLCSDPSSAWAIRAMRKVDEEAKNKALQEQGQNEDVSTSNTTPAPSTEKVTTEGRQTWEETEVEEVQEREDVAEEMSYGPVGKTCCLQWSTTRIPLEQIVNYTIQSEGACPVRAVLLKTRQGKTLCSDPSSDWAIRAMRKVDEEAKNKALQEQGQNEDGSTSNTTPAPSTEKITTEGRQTWEETEVEEVQEREDVAEEMCEDSQDKSAKITPPRVLMYCINNKQT